MAADNVLNTATNSLNHKQSIARGQKIGKPHNSFTYTPKLIAANVGRFSGMAQ